MIDGKIYVEKLDLFLQLSGMVDSFIIQKCYDCQKLREELIRTTDILTQWPNITDEQYENYIETLRDVSKRLRKEHGYRQDERLRGCLSAIACTVLGAILVFSGIGYIAITSNPNYPMFGLLASLDIVVSIIGIAFLVRGFRNIQGQVKSSFLKIMDPIDNAPNQLASLLQLKQAGVILSV